MSVRDPDSLETPGSSGDHLRSLLPGETDEPRSRPSQLNADIGDRLPLGVEEWLEHGFGEATVDGTVTPSEPGGQAGGPEGPKTSDLNTQPRAPQWWEKDRCVWPGCRHWIPQRQKWCDNCGRRQGFWASLLAEVIPKAPAADGVSNLRAEEASAEATYRRLKAQLSQLRDTSQLVESGIRRSDARQRLTSALAPAEKALLASIARCRGQLWSIAALRWFNRLRPVIERFADGAVPEDRQEWDACYQYVTLRRSQGDLLLDRWHFDQEARSEDNSRGSAVVSNALDGLDHLVERMLILRATQVTKPISGFAELSHHISEGISQMSMGAELSRLTELGDEAARLHEEAFRISSETDAEALAAPS